MIVRAAVEADQLPAQACPDDRVVSVLTLHPAFVAKSYHPGALLEAAGFEQVGSKPVKVTPSQIARQVRDGQNKPVVETVPGEDSRATTQLFVASTRGELRQWAEQLESNRSLGNVANDLVRIESFSLPTPEERLRTSIDLPERVPLEVVLHAAGQPWNYSILRAFSSYAHSLGADAQMERRYDVGSLSFVPVDIGREQIRDLAFFSFLRVARLVPRLRELAPTGNVFRSVRPAVANLPVDPPLDPDLRVAVFDGGLPDQSPLAPWASAYSDSSLGAPVQDLLDHGQDVTSALLFGTVDSPTEVKRPFSYVDHYRVLDADVNDPFELFDVIQRIELVLTQKSYSFVNLSIGPCLPIEDDDVHAWTAFVDNHLREGRTLLTAAVGNNGAEDAASGNARIQVPADSVNALAVGAVNSRHSRWSRASYSALGPGRSPGLVKPDLLAFGGTEAEPFVTVGLNGNLVQTCGTSFAAPLTMRTALGIRALFGERIDPLTLKALLIHTAEASGDIPNSEHGWGRVPNELDRIVACDEGIARVVYQGELFPAKYLRARLPLPNAQLPGMVVISATIAIATDVDPADPSNYTRSGIEVVFRPHEDYFANDEAVNPRPRSFFSRSGFASEADRRRDAGKWETVLNRTERLRGSSLFRPVFDIHYAAREEGHPTRTAPSIRYAMVISVESKNVPDLYDQVLQTYATQLQALVPVLNLPVGIPVV
jgi:hypothetical protein